MIELIPKVGIGGIESLEGGHGRSFRIRVCV
jgi:hypothetical protein